MEQASALNPSICALPPAISDQILIAAIDGEADVEVLNHLRRCPACAARAATLAQLQGRLRARLYRVFCPTSERLIAYRQGLLGYEQRGAIAAHVANCPHCARELALVEQVEA